MQIEVMFPGPTTVQPRHFVSQCTMRPKPNRSSALLYDAHPKVSSANHKAHLFSDKRRPGKPIAARRSARAIIAALAHHGHARISGMSMPMGRSLSSAYALRAAVPCRSITASDAVMMMPPHPATKPDCPEVRRACRSPPDASSARRPP